MPDFIDTPLSLLVQNYHLHAQPETAIGMAKYMKNHFLFLGITSPQRASLNKTYFDQYGVPSASAALSAAVQLWQLPQREFQYLAVDVMKKAKSAHLEESIGIIEQLITEKSWWDSVDHHSGALIGDYFKRYPQHIEPIILEHWNKSSNIWLQRVSLIFQLSYKQKTHYEVLEECIAHCRYSKEFFVQKAIGWALRNVARHDPAFVRAVVAKYHLAPLSRREALKHIGEI